MTATIAARKSASTQDFTVIRLGQHLGAEIRGIDLSEPLDDGTFARLAKAFFENEVVFLRNQKLTPEQQVAFTRRFGVPEQHVRKEHRLDGYPEILIVSTLCRLILPAIRRGRNQ